MDIVQEKYLLFFQKEYKKILINPQSKYACVIVEPRLHPNLEFVIKNVLFFLPNFSLYIFHSNENKKFVEEIIGHNLSNVHFHNFTSGNITIEEYNELLTSPYFYETIHAEDILIFQTDSYIRKSGIECFLEYNFAMIGAPWHWYDAAKPQGGNGGFCFRKKDLMLNIIKHAPFDKTCNEDYYFHKGCLELGYLLPTKEISQFFSMETIYCENSYAIHKAWYYIPEKDFNSINLEI
jgi:hypothetical protein